MRHVVWMRRAGVLGLFLLSGWVLAAEPAKAGERYLRFRSGDSTAYGVLEGDRVRELKGDLFGEFSKTDRTHALRDVTLLPPTKPTQVFALASNYRSHLGTEEIPPLLRIPQPFLKPVSCLIADGETIVIPKDAPGPVVAEGELVIVIGKRASKVSKEDALDYVLGVTCGNDVSDRHWQNDEGDKDIQWWRAKGADTFGPVGPYIASGLDYDNLLLRVRINGEVKQEENTSNMIHNVADTVSFISRYVTLHPGDLIFTGTSGETPTLHPGDVVEVEMEGVGVLRNTVAGEE